MKANAPTTRSALPFSSSFYYVRSCAGQKTLEKGIIVFARTMHAFDCLQIHVHSGDLRKIKKIKQREMTKELDIVIVLTSKNYINALKFGFFDE